MFADNCADAVDRLLILKGGLLAAELNTAYDLTTLKDSLLAAELNTVYYLILL